MMGYNMTETDNEQYHNCRNTTLMKVGTEIWNAAITWRNEVLNSGKLRDEILRWACEGEQSTKIHYQYIYQYNIRYLNENSSMVIYI